MFFWCYHDNMIKNSSWYHDNVILVSGYHSLSWYHTNVIILSCQRYHVIMITCFYIIIKLSCYYDNVFMLLS
jgi:hypothetical protein